jgi:hypothetical protein
MFDRKIVIEFSEFIETDDITEDWLREKHFSPGDDGWSLLLEPVLSGAAITELVVHFYGGVAFVVLKQGSPKHLMQPDDIVALTSLAGKLTKTKLTRLIESLGGRLK